MILYVRTGRSLLQQKTPKKKKKRKEASKNSEIHIDS